MLKRYMLGALAARTGDEMSGPALLLVGLAATGSAGPGAALLAGATAAAAVGGPVVGALLDRSPRPGRLLAWAIGGHAAALAVLPAGLGHLPYGWILAVAVCAGLLGPALSGGWSSRLPTLVAGDGLPRANALDAMSFTLAGLAGPALAAGLALLLGAPLALTLALALMTLAVPAALLLPVAPAPAPEGSGAPAAPGKDPGTVRSVQEVTGRSVREVTGRSVREELIAGPGR
ncbi:MFS transporter [Streptomyces sp. NPDC000594]|uniref:MFS transporter n=1 Tax=Streptomyces sp. NPDC000594 TaxID=3154261 RepID=UPI00331919C9